MVPFLPHLVLGFAFVLGLKKSQVIQQPFQPIGSGLLDESRGGKTFESADEAL
jgi:hypothetical protein